MVMEGGLTWGGGEHTMQCAGDMLWNCDPELLTSVTPTNSIERKKHKQICILLGGRRLSLLS